MIDQLLIFGATGDLTGRYLLPALAELHDSGQLPADFHIVGAAIEAWDDERFREHAARELAEHTAPDVATRSREAVVRALRYRRVDFDDQESVAGVLDAAGAERAPLAVYLALPTAIFPPAIRALQAIGLPPGSRLALEKPFGEDLESARALNRLLRASDMLGEQAIFRVDHVLGLATVQNLLTVRFANRIFEPLWNSDHIERVEILWDETLGLEGRAGYYDHAGALKDVIQNHLLQVLCIMAMERPQTSGADALRDARLSVLQSIPTLSPREAAARSQRARYTAGQLDGRAVPAYREEEGVDPERDTETFAAIQLEIDNARWRGATFLLRTGKALDRPRKEARIHFHQAPPLPFGDRGSPPANELRIGLDGPHGFAFHLTGLEMGPPAVLTPLVLGAEQPRPDLPAYSRVLMALLSGSHALSIRGDEAEAAWRVVTPFLEAWRRGLVPMASYPAGSEGPPPRATHRV